MELVVVADLEGISTVTERQHCIPGDPGHRQALEAYREDVEAVAAAAAAVGIHRIGLLDWHGRTFPPAFFSDRVIPLRTLDHQQPRVAVLLGFHARSGQRAAFAPATLVPGLRLLWEGREAGELALASRWLGERGIPVALVTGDRGLTTEAEEWTDQTATVAVKRAETTERAEALPGARARAAIAEMLQRVLERRSWWWVYRPTPPLALRLQWPDGSEESLAATSMMDLFHQLRAVLAQRSGGQAPGLPSAV
ncbi:MAG: M55 family metallopeptidase [Thermomicrobium sp.]|nr:M55 family metallopeptidase [Thermomicrobium sp.]